jgi:uncharacterized protein YndB with AHSA1/START domain
MTDERVIGELREEEGRGVVRIEDTYPTGIDDLWSAITQPERLRRWIGDVSGDLRIAGEFRAAFTSGWTGAGVVEVCEAPHRLRVRMTRPGQESTVMEALLEADGPSTRLVIEERGLPLDDYVDHGAGWQAHAEDLDAYVEGREPGDWRARWRQLIAAYMALSGR